VAVWAYLPALDFAAVFFLAALVPTSLLFRDDFLHPPRHSSSGERVKGTTFCSSKSESSLLLAEGVRYVSTAGVAS
jgi:hypothetical protein